MSIWNFLSGLISPVTKLVDDLHTSAEEKLIIKTELVRMQTEFATKALEYERSLFEAQADVIGKEATSESTLTRTWRPITMLTFVGFLAWYILATTFGWRTPPENIVLEMFSIIKYGLSGYIVGRSAEKIIPGVVDAFKKREEV